MARASWEWASPEVRGVHYQYTPGQTYGAPEAQTEYWRNLLGTAPAGAPNAARPLGTGFEDIQPPAWQVPGGLGEEGSQPPYEPFNAAPYGTFSDILQKTGFDFVQQPTGAGPAGGGGGKGPGALTGAPNTSTQQQGAGTPTITGPAPAGTKFPDYNQQLLFQKLLAMLTGGGAAFTPAAVPDFRAEALAQAELARKRAGLRYSEEAAATGGAGGRDLGYRQSLLDEALFNAGGNIGAEQAGRQFQANLQAKTLEAQQKQAEFRQVIAMLQALGAFTR